MQTKNKNLFRTAFIRARKIFWSDFLISFTDSELPDLDCILPEYILLSSPRHRPYRWFGQVYCMPERDTLSWAPRHIGCTERAALGGEAARDQTIGHSLADEGG